MLGFVSTCVPPSSPPLSSTLTPPAPASSSDFDGIWAIKWSRMVPQVQSHMEGQAAATGGDQAEASTSRAVWRSMYAIGREGFVPSRGSPYEKKRRS